MFNNVSFKELHSGELNAVLILEIVNIPDKEILGDITIEEAEINSKLNIGRLLSEIYQTYKMNITAGLSCDISLELLWLTEKVDNQPYKARIRLFLIIRYIGQHKAVVADAIKGICRLCTDSLQAMKYKLIEVDYESFMSEYKKINDNKIQAIVKGESLNNLQNQILPVCYSYDIIPENNADLSNISNSLIEYPDSAVSIQLIPTYFEAEELQTINQMTQMLDSLRKGIGMDLTTSISDSLADTYAQRYKYYEQNKAGNLFNYNILVYGNEYAVDNIEYSAVVRPQIWTSGTACP